MVDLSVTFFQHCASILSINIAWPTKWFAIMKWIRIGSLGFEMVFDVQSEEAYWLCFFSTLFFPVFLLFMMDGGWDFGDRDLWQGRHIDSAGWRKRLAICFFGPAAVLIVCGRLLQASLGTTIGAVWAMLGGIWFGYAAVQRRIFILHKTLTGSDEIAYSNIRRMTCSIYDCGVCDGGDFFLLEDQ